MPVLPLHSSSAFGTTVQDNLTILIDLDSNALGSPSGLVSRAVRHLCGLVFPEEGLEQPKFDDYDMMARDYYQQIRRSDVTGRQCILFLAYLSGFFHELRHVHDLMASTYGQEFLFRTLNCYQNTPALLGYLADWSARGQGRTVLLPIHKNRDLPEDVVALLDYYAKVCSDIRAFQNPKAASPAGITTTHLLEGSAVDVQLDFTHELFGEEAVFSLVELVQKGDRSRIYLQIRNDLAEIFYVRGFRGWGLGAVMNYLLWTSLTGSTLPGKSMKEGPTSVVFFEGLAEYITRLADPNRLDLVHAKQLVLEFCNYWGLLPPESMVSRAKELFQERVVKGQEKARKLGVETSQMFINAYKCFAEAYRILNEQILSNPEQYFAGRGYVWCVIAGLLPRVHVKLKVDGQLHDFMSMGKEVVPFPDWNLISTFSTTFKVLTEGRGISPLSFAEAFFENLCLATLKAKEWREVAIRFEDRSSLFDW